MDLLSHFLASLSVSSTTIAKWQIYKPFGVAVKKFSPRFFLSHVSGPALSIQTAGGNYVFEQGDLFIAPAGGECKIGFAESSHYTGINDLEWQVVGEEPYDIGDHHPASLGVTVGHGKEATELLGIAFEIEFNQGAALATSLPRFIKLKSRDNPLYQLMNPAINFLVNDHKPGYFGVATKLAEFTVIASIRGYILSEPDFAAGALRGMADKRLSKALQAIHSSPEHDWSVEKLAAVSTMSRSNFAARFTSEVGESPIEYLYKLRIQMAKRLLSQSKSSISEVAEAVGFSSDRVFRNVFNRFEQLSPRAYKNAQG
ncbi:helix-turn-helix transcriptional regulator [Alteromonas sp. NFXS44]|uniref:AraC family transcriptional regulator n=1 Tax=Alteromonas sp. NFXS44 TaxID=2818435 RepID=UPI0032E013D1